MGGGETLSCRDFGGVSHINHAFRDYRVRADKFQLSRMCYGEVRGTYVGGSGGGGHRRAVVRMLH